MRRVILAILALILLAGAGAAWKRTELARLSTVLTLFDEDRIVDNFSAMNTAFASVTVPRGDGPVTPLPQGRPLPLPGDFDAWAERRAVTSLVVLKHGHIMHESYRLGTGPDDLRIGWSVSKSWLSALTGVLLDRGAVSGLDVPVTRYVPELAGSAYDGVTLRDVLTMQSGVVFDEDYLDFRSDINRMGRVLALGGSMDAFTAARTETDTRPGVDWRYVSLDTHVIGMVLRGATGFRLADLLAQHIVTPMGLEAAPYYLTDGYGTAFALGGLAATTRDQARMGLMYLQDGQLGGRQIVPADWVRASTIPQANTDPGAIRYGYQWWIPADAVEGEFLARGVYGQYVWVDRSSGVVIASTGADRAFREDGAFDDALQMFRRLRAAASEE